MKAYKKHILQVVLFSIVFAGAWALSGTGIVHAQADTLGTGNIENTIALGGGDIRVTVMKIIRATLGLLGIVAVSLMLYAGFTWMTSEGSEEKIGTAKKIMVNAGIGLAIILSSFAIVQFVINGLLQANGRAAVVVDAPNVVCNDPNGCVLPGPGPDCAQQGFVVTSISPNTQASGMSNAVVRVLFSKKLHRSVKPAEDVTIKVNGEDPLPIKKGVIFADGYGIELHVDTTTPVCDAQQQGKQCIPPDTYVIEVHENVRSVGNQQLETVLACGNFERSAVVKIDADAIDNTTPSAQGGQNAIDIVPPAGMQVGRGAQNGFIVERNQEYSVETTIVDRQAGQGGISYGSFEMKRVLPRVGNPNEYFDGPLVADGTDGAFLFAAPMPISQATPHWSVFELKITAHDIDNNEFVVTSSVTVVGEGCLANPGAAECLPPPECEDDRQCGGAARCVARQCVAWPMITDVSPMEGAEKNWVTISGRAFGDDAGRVQFAKDINDNGSFEENEWRDAVLASCGPQDVWKDSYVIAEVPDDALIPLGTTNSIRIARKQEDPADLSVNDATTDRFGPLPGDREGLFTKNNISTPGLCGVVSVGTGLNAGVPTEEVLATGKGFGAQGPNDVLSFGGIQTVASNWVDTKMNARVPAGAASGTVGVFVKANGKESNAVPFSIRGSGEEVRPIIEQISPTGTTRLSYVTIIGQRFGDIVGEVWLAANQGAVQTCIDPVARDASCKQMDVDLPRECGTTWRNTQLVVKVPGDIAVGDYALLLRSAQGVTDGSHTFTVENGAPKPGICAISPLAGPAQFPVGKHLILYGTNFIPGPIVSFWKDGANEQSPDATWFSLQLNEDPAVRPKVQSAVKQNIVTDLPVGQNGETMPPGLRPIAVTVNNVVSNYIYYAVADCREDKDSAPGANYQCCQEGPEAGFWKEGNQVCAGEVREAGYVWRFTSGRVPSLPRVLEQCEVAAAGVDAIQPSPTPALQWKNGQNACVNSLINIQFSHAMDPASFDNAVHVYQCPPILSEGVRTGEYTCADNDIVDVSDEYEVEMQGNDGIHVNFKAPRVSHDANSYYRVVLDREITGETVVEGLNVPEQVPLLASKVLPGDENSAYFFDFITGDGVCRLDSVAIRPSVYTITALGTLLDPRYGLNPEFIQDFLLYGRGNQECAVVDPGEGWEWSVNRNIVNIINNADTTQKVRAEAINDAGENNEVLLRATSNTIQLTGTSKLLFDLGDPKVTEFWPRCGEACPNASFGVKFSRDMFLPDLNVDGALSIEKCLDGETCLQTQQVLLFDVEITNPKVFEKQLPQDVYLDPASWYIATLSADLRAVAQIDAQGNQIRPGRSLAPIHNGIDAADPLAYKWKFRTKEDDELCLLDHTSIEPAPYVARTVGEQTNFSVIPYSSPDACSDSGQRLNPWGYGWSWNSTEEAVAVVSDFQTTIERAPFCSNACVPRGSMAALESPQYLCGNGVVDPGEDCDVGIENADGTLKERIGVSCTLACLHPGNSNGIIPNAEPGENICGNGGIETEVGEECDDRNNSDGDGCSSICLLEGANQEKSDDPRVPWCGSGTKTEGEECDINLPLATAQGNDNINIEWSAVGCTQQCLHQGTALSQAFCEAHGAQELQIIGAAGGVQNVALADLPQCAQAISMCGNGIVEQGEECEFSVNADGSLEDVLIVGNREYPVEGVETYCTNRCTLQNICGLPALSEDGHGVRCTEGEGCAADCTYAGSSVRYAEQSVCGDGDVGTGEYAQCEIAVRQEVAVTLGQNPVQLATAIGEGEVEPGTDRQHTEIQSIPTVVRNRNGDPLALNDAIQEDGKATADYYLQCGFDEYASASLDVLKQRDGGFERGRFGAIDESNLWTPTEIGNAVIEITTTTVLSGSHALHIKNEEVAPGRGVFQNNISLSAGTYQLSFKYKQVGGTLKVFIPGHVGDAAIEQGQDEWHVYTKEFTLQAPRADLTLSLEKVEGEVFIDDVQLRRVNRDDIALTNNCPGNANNAQGVGSNSCCYERSGIVDTYPIDGSGLAGSGQPAVCRNTYIELTFNGELDKDTLPGSMVLVRGIQDPNETCAQAGEEDVTAQVRSVLALDATEELGFWKGIWNTIKTFLAELFTGKEAVAGVIEPQNVLHWCASAHGFDHEVRYQRNDDGVITQTRVSLFLSNVLQAESIYGVMVRGGDAGIQDIRGVGVRGRALPGQAIFPLSDSLFFQTTNQICRLKDVTVSPKSYVYTTPEESYEFFADTVADNGGRIVRTPAYDWDWRWIPRNTVLYTVPSDAGEIDRTIMPIASTQLEGSLAMSAQALVTVDTVGDEGENIDDSHVGRAFTGYSQLTSAFCENPWPPRSVSPYEDGVPFGQDDNNDAFVGGAFTGGEMTQVAGEYFNFSMSYCADAGTSGDTEDDLPVLEPAISHDGVCQYTRNACSTSEDCPYVGVTNARVAYNNGNGEGVCTFEGGNVPVLINKSVQFTVNGHNNLYHQRFTCTSDQQCQQPDLYKDVLGNWNVSLTVNGGRAVAVPNASQRDVFIANATCDLTFVEDRDIPRDQCVGIDPEVPETIDRSIKQTLFFNQTNDDLIGMRVYDNTDRLSVADWYAQQQFGFSSVESVSIDGFDAVTDGSSYFINFLNKEKNGLIQSYILALTINEQPQASTKKVFDQLLESLKFNINMSDFGLCLLNQDAQGRDIMQMPRDAETLGQVSGTFCQTDFDCRDDNGEALEELSGICSLEKSKFRNDWNRLIDLRRAQGNLAAYKERTGSYPDLLGGSYIPTYTNSRWNTSWSALGQEIGGLPLAYNNSWSTCDADDQTCWNADNQQFMCPNYASVYEYKYNVSTKEYMLHAQLEYFRASDSIIKQFVSLNNFTTDRWCEGQAVGIGDGQERCGDGVLNPATEQCDPPGATKIDPNNPQCAANEVGVTTCNAQCQYEFVQCQEASRCGDGFVDANAGEVCDDGPRNGQYGFCAGPSEGVEGCQARSPISCGNGSLDYVDTNGDGQFNRGEIAHELCDTEGGVCQYIIPDVGRVAPSAFLLVDRSGSLRPNDWVEIKGFLNRFVDDFAPNINLGMMLFPQTSANNDGCKVDTEDIIALGDYSGDTQQVKNLYANVAKGGSTPTPGALKRIREERLLELENDELSAFRPKKLIIITDGEPTCTFAGEPEFSIAGRELALTQTVDELTALYALGVETHIIALGIDNNNIDRMALAGGGNPALHVDNPDEIYDVISELLGCQEYSLRSGNTCALNCQNFGQFCGDGVRQAQEECDDGNAVNGDGCNAFCQSENIACKQVAPFENQPRPAQIIVEVRANGGAGQPFDQCFE